MNWSRLPLVLSIAALAAAAVSWFISAGQIQELREGQRSLVTSVAALQKVTVIDVTGAPARGSEDAVVTLIEFSDYECPFCIRHFKQTMPQIEANYVQAGKVRYVFRDFPVDALHPAAIRAHEAGRCADEQGKFWALHDKLFSPAGSHTPEALEARATEAGLSMAGFRACIASGRTTSAIRRSVAEVMALGANGTPAFFVGLRDRATGQVRVQQAISGAHPYEVFSRAIDAALKKAG